MNRLQMIILHMLSAEQAVTNLSAMTVREISELDDTGYKVGTISKELRRLEDMNMVSIGYKDGHANTYYITDIGKKILEEQRI